LELVHVVKDGKALLRLVKTGRRTGDKVEILSGIEDGDSVVVQSAAALKDGQPVNQQP
jgi:multidrug efflux pump subunit AcrA (membrane-fusion protein)